MSWAKVSKRKFSTTRRDTQRIEKTDAKPEIERTAINPNSKNGKYATWLADCLTKPSSVTCLIVDKKAVLVADSTTKASKLHKNTNLYFQAYLNKRISMIFEVGALAALNFSLTFLMVGFDMCNFYKPKHV